MNKHSWGNQNGRAIEAIFWPDTEYEQDRQITATDEMSLILHADNLGDRMEVWVIALHTKTGVELNRFNARHLDTITWLPAVQINEDAT